LDLVTTTGLRPRTEFWATGIDMDSGDVAPDVEGPLLTALAEGTFSEGPDAGSDVPLHELERLLSVKRRSVQAERRQDNEAIVEGRIQSRLEGIARKIARTRETLAELRGRHGDPRIIRMHEGRIRNLTDDMHAVAAKLEAQKALTVSSDPVAVLVVHGV
jgi:hypothetical protein